MDSVALAQRPQANLTEKDIPASMIPDGDLTFGDGQRNLPEDLKKALLELKLKFQGLTDGHRARREYLKKCLKLLEFFRGNHYSWWDYTTGSWQANSAQTGGKISISPGGAGQALYVLNFFQGYLLAIEALLTGNKLTVRFFPDDPDRTQDLNATQKADVIIKEFEKRNRVTEKMKEQIFALCICGTFGSYVRTVTDGERFGYVEQPIYDWVDTVFGPPQYACQICGYELNGAPKPAPMNPITGLPETDPATGMPVPPPPNNCDNCGAPLPLEPTGPAPSAPVLTQTDTQKVPRARTMWSIVDGFELKLPPDAAEQSEFPYLIRDREIDKSIPRATYPELVDKINGTYSSVHDNGQSLEYEKRIRRQSTLGTTTENRAVITDDRDRVTLSECWFRPRGFYHIDDPTVRKQLLDLYPRGVKVVFANDVFCEAKSESMDDHWRICHALPGRGQIREPILGSLVPIQEIVNDLLNIIRDVIEYTLPVTFVNTRLLDVRKWGRSQVMAGATYNVNDFGGRPIAEGFYQTQPGNLPEYATTLVQQLRTEVAQFLSGAFPAAYGGGTPGNNTAQGKEIERQSALGRINLYLQALQEHYAELAPLVVQDFVNNSIEPISYVDENHGGEFVMTRVEPYEFEDGRIRQTAECVQEYPSTWAQRQGLLLQMFQMPQFESWTGLMKNLTKVKLTLGTDLKNPTEDAYKNTFRLIYRLLKEQPGPPQMVPMGPPDPMTGMPTLIPGPPTPSITPDPPIVFDIATAAMACKDFYESHEGQKALAASQLGGQAALGWQNFLAFAQALQPPAPPPMPPGAPGQPPPPAGPPPEEAEQPG